MDNKVNIIKNNKYGGVYAIYAKKNSHEPVTSLKSQ